MHSNGESEHSSREQRQSAKTLFGGRVRNAAEEMAGNEGRPGGSDETENRQYDCGAAKETRPLNLLSMYTYLCIHIYLSISIYRSIYLSIIYISIDIYKR